MRRQYRSESNQEKCKMKLTLTWLFMQDVLDNNVTLKPDTVVHVWKWWPVATGASVRAKTGASTDDAVRAVHAMPPDTSPGCADPATSSLRSDQHHGQHGSQIFSQHFTQQPDQQSSQQQPLHWSAGPVDCQLSMGCPGEIGRYSAGEEPGWFPEMEKVTAQARASPVPPAIDYDHYLSSLPAVVIPLQGMVLPPATANAYRSCRP